MGRCVMRALAVAFVAGLACSGCGGSGGSADGREFAGQFGGKLEGTDALVGIVVGAERLTVYVCDDGTISEWFVTDEPAPSLTLASRGGAVVSAVFAAGAVSGTVTLADGAKHEFHATLRPTPVIHRAEAVTEGGAVLAGWLTVGDRTTGALVRTPKVGKPIVGRAPSLPSTGLVGLPVDTITLPTPLVTITDAGRASGAAPSGSFPEYAKVWQDGSLNVVAVFGVAGGAATASQDAGIEAYDLFIADLKMAFAGAVTIPTSIPSAPGESGLHDIEFRGALPDDRRIRFNVLFVDSILTATAPFHKRYGSLTTDADVIAYVGRSQNGLPGRVLVERARFVAGQYLVVLVACCHKYGDPATIAGTRSALNADDPQGTKYMDVVTNVRAPAFVQGRMITTALAFRLLNRDAPASYDQILGEDWLVTGAEDNTFVPPALPGGATSVVPWSGIDESGVVARSEEKRFQTEMLDAGSYLISLSGSGDTDLYVRRGSPPTATTYDCRPARAASPETCVVQLTTPASLHIMVRGQADSSTYRLIGQPQ